MTPPAPVPRPPRRIVLLTGPSGSGKGVVSRRAGLPVVALDDFYRDGDDPTLPHRFGIGDWDDPASWHGGAALAALTGLAHDGVATVPTYSISASRRTGETTLDAGDCALIVAEGIFAAELIRPLAAAGLLADAIVLDRPVAVVILLRLLRDLREARKPLPVLLRRGVGLARDQRRDMARWVRAGLRPLGLHRAVRELRVHRSLAEAERRIIPGRGTSTTLDITAVCFLREGAAGTELLCVRKHGTGSWMQVGGKLEPGESAQAAALREVHEEIGIVLAESDLEPLGSFGSVAANEPGTLLRATVFTSSAALPDPLRVRAELAEHRWIPLGGAGQGIRLAPLMTEHLLPALRARSSGAAEQR